MMYDIADTFLTAGESDFVHADHTAAAAHSPANAESGGPTFPTFMFSLADTRRPSTLSRIVSPTFLSLITDLICELSHIPHRMADMPAMMWSYKYMPREIARCLSYFRGEPPILHPHLHRAVWPYDSDSSALCAIKPHKKGRCH